MSIMRIDELRKFLFQLEAIFPEFIINNGCLNYMSQLESQSPYKDFKLNEVICITSELLSICNPKYVSSPTF